jgi:hypothetical protein
MHIEKLRTIDLSCLVTISGIDVVGILSKTKGGFKHIFIAIETFAKWIEVEPIVNITQEVVVKFLKSIIFLFGVPRWAIMFNDAQ